MSEEEQDIMTSMYRLTELGVEPEEYEKFFQIFNAASAIIESGDLESGNDFSFFEGKGLTSAKIEEYTPLENAEDYTFVLKIQIDGVKKPLMWREVEIPADIDFHKLHIIIQELMGFKNCHLWQFNKLAYDDSLYIINLIPETPWR